MSVYRTGRHWGVTIVLEGDDAELVAVVVNGDQVLAEKICRLLNSAEESGVTVQHCGSSGAHSPHGRCSGIMPIWPCGAGGNHYTHEVEYQNVRWHCPGTVYPPTDMIGPWYPASIVPDES